MPPQGIRPGRTPTRVPSPPTEIPHLVSGWRNAQIRLLFEGLLCYCISGLRVILYHRLQHLDPSYPILHLVAYPLHLCPGVPYITPQVVDPRNDGKPFPLE